MICGTSTSTTPTTLGTAVLLNNGQAELVLNEATLTGLPAGAVISAVYTPGNGNYAGSSSQTITPTISSTLSSTRLSVQPSGPVSESSAAFSITVGPGRSSSATTAPTGTVSFYDATTGLALPNSPVTLTAGTTTSTASFSTTFTTPGLHLVIATYSGDGTYAGHEVIIPVYVQGTGASSGGTGYGGGGGFGFGRDGGFGLGGFGGLNRPGRGW